MPIITPNDLAPFATIVDGAAKELIADVEAEVMHIAPCLADPDLQLNEQDKAWLKARVRKIALRWNDSDSGVKQRTQSAGEFSESVTYETTGHRTLWKSEIADFVSLCKKLKPDEPSTGSVGTFCQYDTATKTWPGFVINAAEQEL